MLRIACPELIADLRVDVGPEAFEVIRHLLGTHVRCEQMEQDRHAPASNPGRVGQAEELLHASRKHRRPTSFIVQSDSAPARNLETLWHVLIDPPELCVCKSALEHIKQRRST